MDLPDGAFDGAPVPAVKTERIDCRHRRSVRAARLGAALELESLGKHARARRTKGANEGGRHVVV